MKASSLANHLRLWWTRGVPWALSVLNDRRYRTLTERELRATRRSDMVFVFGSGHSINDISADGWAYFERHDTLSFNWFVHQDRVHVDYHLVREVSENDLDAAVWRPKVLAYSGLIRSNPLYKESIFLVQSGWRAINGNRLVGMKLLPEESRLFRFKSAARRFTERPSPSFSQGLFHGPSTLIDCVNFAHIMGWRRIVLVGVDLYDRRYFWLGDGATRDNDVVRGASHEERHNSSEGVMRLLEAWGGFLSREGVELSVFNPRSLLASVLPVFDRGLVAGGPRAESTNLQ